MKISIEKGVPIQRRRIDMEVYPFADMEIGDSFLATKENSENPHAIRSAAYEAGKRFGRKYVTRSVEGGIRVWRVS